MSTGVLPGIRKLREASDFTGTIGAGQDGFAMVYQHSSGTFVLASAGGGGGTTNHAALLNLDFAVAGHTGFAGTGVSNTFTQNQTFQASISVGNDVTVTDDVTVGDDLTVNGLAVITESLSVPLLTTAGNADLVVNPGGTGDLVLDDSTAFHSATFDSSFPIAGFNLGPTALAGQFGLTVGEIAADTFKVVTFVANETRVERANQYWTRGYGITTASFTTPGSVGGTVSVTFEDSPSIAGALASSNHYGLFRTVDISTGFAAKQAWGQLTSYVDNADGTQTWTFTLRSGDTSTEFLKGSLCTIFGASGDAYIHLSVNDSAGAPYIKGRRWVTNPYTPANHTTYWLLGTLGSIGSTGTPSYTPSGNGIYARSGASANQLFIIDDNGMQIRNGDLEMYNSGVQTVDLASADGSLKLGTNVASGSTTGFQFNGTTGNITIGGASYSPTVTLYGVLNIKAGSSGIANLTDANLDNIANGSTYFRTTANQVTGAGRAFTALDSSNRLVTAVIPASAVTPSGAGLYLDSSHMGYYSGSAWKTYMDSSGNLLLAGSSAANYIQWAAATNKLSGVGSSVEQWYASAADGKLYAGAGEVWLASNGLNFNVQTFGSADYIRFDRSGSALATIGFQRATGGGPLTTDGMTFTNNDNTKFRFLGASVMEIGTGGDTVVNITGGLSATKSGNFASLTVTRGALSAAATIGGTTHTSVFSNSTTEHTYIRGGKASSNVYINDASGLGDVILATGGGRVGAGVTPTMKLDVADRMLVRSGASGAAGIWLADSTPTSRSFIGLYSDGATPILGLYNNGNWRMLVDSNGHVGVNAVADTTYMLDVLVPSGAQNIFRAGQSGVSNGLTITTTGSELAYTFLLGNVHIGATGNPNWKFNVSSGTGQLSFNPDFSGVNYLSSYISASAGPLALYGSRVFVDGDTLGISTAKTPASASATGTTGMIAWDSSYIYVAVGTNTWRRVAHATW